MRGMVTWWASWGGNPKQLVVALRQGVVNYRVFVRIVGRGVRRVIVLVVALVFFIMKSLVRELDLNNRGASAKGEPQLRPLLLRSKAHRRGPPSKRGLAGVAKVSGGEVCCSYDVRRDGVEQVWVYGVDRTVVWDGDSVCQLRESSYREAAGASVSACNRS